MDLTKLKDPFKEHDIEWRVQSSGSGQDGKCWCMVLCYVTNRAIMDRLDEVCGIANWKNEFKQAPDGGVLCGISIKCLDEWVTKWDGAENTNVESVKGGLSSAMKRAGVQWNIGRYLYKLDATFGIVVDNGSHFSKTKDGKKFKWNPPALPKWALPDPRPKGIFEEKMQTLDLITTIKGLTVFRESLINFIWDSEESKNLREHIKEKQKLLTEEKNGTC